MPSVQPFSTSVGVITVSRAGNFIRPTCAKLPLKVPSSSAGTEYSINLLNLSSKGKVFGIITVDAFIMPISPCIQLEDDIAELKVENLNNWCLGPRSKGKGWAGNYFLSSSPPQPNRGPHASRFP